jgi:hypothetical protein
MSAVEKFWGKNSSRLPSLNPEAQDRETWTRQAEEAHTQDQDCGRIELRLSTVAGWLR